MKDIQYPTTIRLKQLLITARCLLKTVYSKLYTLNSLLLTFICLLTTVNSYGQTYPINAQVVTSPPYSLFLTDFATGNNIQVSLIDRRINSDMQQVYLNIELEGGGIRLRTLPNFRPSAYIDVVPNMMLTLTNSDLSEYFNVNSLSFEGIGKEAFVANAQTLPDGLYKLKIKAIHMINGIQVSNEAIALMSLQRGQPPFINLPMNNTKVPENPTQNFIIQWTNRNMAGAWTNPPSYRLQMWEMPDPSQDPNIIVNSNYPPILDDYSNISTYQHGLSNTPLTAGRSYVLRVQVLDPEGRDVYTNGGYSQVVKFTYGDACDPPTNLTATQDTRGIAINWSAAPGSGYHLQYSRIDTAWQETEVMINRFQIEKIYPSAQYQMRVASLCGAGKQSDYSKIVYITTKPSGSNNQAACGDPFPKMEFKSKTLLPSLNVDDKFTAFDFDITVTRVHRNDSTSYKGEGTTPFNMLGGVPTVVYFEGIKINTDRQLIEGAVKFQQKPYVFSDKDIKQFREDFKDTQEMMTGNDVADPETVKVDVTIGTVVYDSTKKQIIINDVSGNVNKTLTAGKDYKITDKDGNIYLVSKDNKITKQPKATETTVKNGGPQKNGGENNDLYFVEGQPVLTFSAHPQQTWSFDAMELNSMGDALYENIRNDEEAYYVPYKSIGSAGADKVTARLYANPKNVDLKRIKFKTNEGVAVPFTFDAIKQEWTLELTAGLHRNDFSVFPYYGNGKDTLCGKLNVMPLDRKEVNLVLVPLNGYKGKLSASDVEGYLNKVYNQANIAYKVSMDGAFSTAAADQPLSVEHGKLEGEYSDNQAQVIVDYQTAHPEADNTIYLFLCKEGSNEAVKGHTPVNRSYGFIFGETVDKRTIAHEVGHGYPLALEHPFTDGGATGTYSNLMDYVSATNLSFLQWGGAHNPKLKVRFGQKPKEGQFSNNNCKLIFRHTYDECPKIAYSFEAYRDAIALPYEKSWKDPKCQPTYWLSIDRVPDRELQFDDKGNQIETDVLIKLNSPYTLKAYTRVKKQMDFHGDYIENYFKTQYIPFALYTSIVEDWIKKHYDPSTEVDLQHAMNVTRLAKALLRNGELNPIKTCNLQPDILYEMNFEGPMGRQEETVYYNSEEVSALLWGFVAKRYFNFQNSNQALAFAIQYLDNQGYQAKPKTLTFAETPWRHKALSEGWLQTTNNYFTQYVNYNMNYTYSIPTTNLIEGITNEDLIEVTIWLVAGEYALAEKITVAMATKMATSASVNMLTQIGVNVICGKTYEEAIKGVDYGDVFWTGTTSAIGNFHLAAGLDCIKDMSNVLQDKKSYNLATGKEMIKACCKKLFFNYAFGIIASEPGSLCHNLLKKGFQKQSLNQIRTNLMKNLSCSGEDVDAILRAVPSEFMKKAVEGPKEDE